MFLLLISNRECSLFEDFNVSQIVINSCNISSSIPFGLQDNLGTVIVFSFKGQRVS